jgi:hypothetical protein
MKRLLTFFAVILLGVTLVACKNNQAGQVTATIDQFDVELTSMSFKATINDPDSEITGAITVTLFDSTGKIVHTKDISALTELDNYSVGSLVNTMTYTLKIYATIGRNSVILVERTFQLASAATIEISTVEQFKNMVSNRAGNYVLVNDLDFSGAVFTSPFTSAFSGTFDGQGHTLQNITFDKIVSYTGVFGYISGGLVKNVNFDHVTIGTEDEPIQMTTSARVGIVAGYVASSTGKIENVNVTNSTINFSTSSTVQAYVGGLIGEFKGNLQNATISDSLVKVRPLSYGRIRVGGAVGFLGEEAVVKDVNSGADVEVNVSGVNLKDRDVNINVGGIIGYHNARNVNRSVENIIGTGDVTVTLDFATMEGTTKGNYSVYIGGIAGIAYSNVNQAIYAGSITVNHDKNAFEENVNKYFFIGGLYGFYGSNKASAANLRLSDGKMITVNVSDDVNLKVSQVVADTSSTAANIFRYVGDLGLMVNSVNVSGDDVIDVITTTDGFFNSTFITDWLDSQIG